MNCPHCAREATYGEHGTGVCTVRGKNAPKREPTLKRCTKCNRIKEANADNFKRRVGIWNAHCRSCVRAEARAGRTTPCDPLKRAAMHYSGSKKNSPEEAAARKALIEAVKTLEQEKAA